MSQSALYPGWVMHRRVRPRHHRFKYRVFAMLLDLDELAALDRTLSLFAWNRGGLFSFHDKDHGDGHDLRTWLDAKLALAGITADGARRVLCYPRIFGYVFNPLSVWFCHAKDGALKAIIYEVHNTYDERHAYVLPVPQDAVPCVMVPEHRPGHASPDHGTHAADGTSMSVGRATPKIVRHGCAKGFYVSPFLSRDCAYQFRIRPPGEDVAIAINEEEAGAPILNASFAGTRRTLSDGALLAMLLRYPLMTLKVVAAIHYEAVRLMLKGVRRHPHTPKAQPAE
jgi:DUF1365 family protein